MARADLDAANRIAWQDAITKVDRDHHATVIHTSGTTANPKGAILSHGNLLYNFEAAMQVIDFYETDVFLAFLPLSHIYGRIVDEMVALGRGAAVVFAEALIERLPANMVEVQPTVMGSVPRLYERVYARVLAAVESGSPTRQRIFHWAAGLGREKYANHLAGKSDSPWLTLQLRLADALVFGKIRARTGGRVRYFVSGSAPLAREIGEFFYGMGMLVLEGYGLTETSPFVSINRPGDFVFGTVGRPAPGSEVKIDPETGEILVRGPQVMQGYLNAPEETARAIDPDGWFHTGDIGELDDIGRIKITDRLKNIIILGNGKNVSPAPMEAALSTSRYVAQAVILGDRQAYTGALIAPDFDELGAWAAQQGIAEMPPEQLIELKEVDRLFDAEVKRTLDGFAIYERPRRVALLPRLLTEEAGELTPSLKTKNRVVLANWPDKIAYLFDEKPRRAVAWMTNRRERGSRRHRSGEAVASAKGDRELLEQVVGVLHPGLHAGRDDHVADLRDVAFRDGRHRRAAVGLLQGDGVDRRVVLRDAGHLEQLGVDETLVRHDLSIRSVERDVDAVGRDHHVAPVAADAQVDVADRDLAALRVPPSADEVGLGEGPVDEVLRRVEVARDVDLGVAGQGDHCRSATGHRRHLPSPCASVPSARPARHRAGRSARSTTARRS